MKCSFTSMETPLTSLRCVSTYNSPHFRGLKLILSQHYMHSRPGRYSCICLWALRVVPSSCIIIATLNHLITFKHLIDHPPHVLTLNTAVVSLLTITTVIFRFFFKMSRLDAKNVEKDVDKSLHYDKFSSHNCVKLR